MYEVYSSVFKTNSLHLDINEKEFKISLEQLKLHLKKKPKLLFLSIPNSPVEVNLSDENIKRIINLCNKSKCIIVFDEAYYGFGIKSQVSNYKKYKNIIINRSFSKSFGLPSIRLGYLISNPKFIKLLKEKN